MKYTYCPNCGARQTITHENSTNPTCQKCKTIFWNNPSATVAVVFRKDNKLLFARRGIEPNKGMYDFPGGFVDYNEDIYQACVREIQEETTATIDVKDLRLIIGYTTEYLPTVSVVDLIFLIEKWRGELVAHDDVAALEWKPPDFINDSQFAPPYPGLLEKLATIR